MPADQLSNRQEKLLRAILPQMLSGLRSKLLPDGDAIGKPVCRALKKINLVKEMSYDIARRTQ